MQAMTLLFQNEHFIVVNKPSGVSFHSEVEAGFVVQVQEKFGSETLYPLHRLDKMTSGLVLFAKSKKIAQTFGKLFEKQMIEKYYLAISLRKPKKKQGWVKGDMVKARRGNYKFAATRENPAITQFISVALRQGERGFLIKPHTGKTHQIRVALKSIGSPISGDMRYAAVQDAKTEERGYLHAYALRFTLDDKEFSFVCAPKNGERFLSNECKEVLQKWSEPWTLFKQKS